MLKLPLSSALIWMVGVVSLGCAGCQKTAARPVASSVTAPAPQEIHVDQHCLILPDKTADPVVCHLESVFASQHPEETVIDGVTRRSEVHITEQEYLLQNVTAAPVMFVVEQRVPEGWQVDSDPQPTEVQGAQAFFRVRADPGQIVRLHVGLRHAVPVSDADSVAPPAGP